MTISLPLPIGETSGSALRIVLSWLIRLRWFAVVGQLMAIAAALTVLELHYPVAPLAAVLAVTLATNALLVAWLRRGPPLPRWLTPAVLVLDVALLTVLLYFTGGPENPFAVLYVVHVAMATVVLGPGWAWAVVATAAACYAVIARWHRPLAPPGALPRWAEVLGEWAALLIVVGVLAYFIGRLVRALRTREQELSSVRERAALNERLASLTTLAAGAAHELGTPLGTIAVVAKELELTARRGSAGGDVEALAEDAALIRQQVDRCREILERMRGDVAGRSSDEPGRCDPREVVEAAADQLLPEARGRLDVSVPPVIPYAAAAPRAVQQAVSFLVNNAFDASPADRRVALSVRAADGRLTFEVRDAGTGMDAETLRRASEPFYTTKDPGRGMGLGLFLVRLVAERNGGRLEMDSAPGVGTTARLVLPAVGQPGADAGGKGAEFDRAGAGTL